MNENHKNLVQDINKKHKTEMQTLEMRFNQNIKELDKKKLELFEMVTEIQIHKEQTSIEINFLKEEIKLAYEITAETKLKFATVATDKDYFQLKYKQEMEIIKELKAEIGNLNDEIKNEKLKKKRFFWEK